MNINNTKKRRVSLSVKINLLIVTIILAVSIGLMTTGYRVYSEKVDNFYFTSLENVSRMAAETVQGELMSHFWKQINTDAFRQARRQAEAAQDEAIISQWLESTPSFYLSYAEEDGEEVDPEFWYSLMDDYESLLLSLNEITRLFSIKEASIQLDVDGVTYNLVEPSTGLMGIGSIEEPIDAFSGYADNAEVPPTIYHSSRGWLCSACVPLTNFYDKDFAGGYVCLDIDMNDVVRDRHMFVVNCVVFVLIQLAIAIGASMLLMRRVVTRPLVSLAHATTAFIKDEGTYSQSDIIELPIRSNDEIGDLYREIRSMQGHIVNYTSHLAVVTAERERVNTELSIATQIQAHMLPQNFPDRPEFNLYATMDPAKEVGGDFYDFLMKDDNHLVLLIADVSDKGVPAALFMMAAKIIINYCARKGSTPGEILTAANDQLCRNNQTKMFVTVWLGILELSTGELSCTNAGHEYPVIRGQDGVFQVYKDRHGLVVGAKAGMKYRDYTLHLQPGDAIFVYTDGVPEANNAAEEFYGMERMTAALNRVAGESPEGILKGVREDVDAFVAGAKQFDDLTMLCLEYKGPAS